VCKSLDRRPRGIRYCLDRQLVTEGGEEADLLAPRPGEEDSRPPAGYWPGTVSLGGRGDPNIASNRGLYTLAAQRLNVRGYRHSLTRIPLTPFPVYRVTGTVL